jgi:hypothetical protein
LTFIFRKEKNHLFCEMSYWFVSSLCTWSLSAIFEFYMIQFIFHTAFMLLIYLFSISDNNFNISIVLCLNLISGSCNGQIFFLYFLYHLSAFWFIIWLFFAAINNYSFFWCPCHLPWYMLFIVWFKIISMNWFNRSFLP